MSGPPPQPTRMKILRGNPGKRPLPKDEPQGKVKSPPCPPELDDQAKAEWKRITKLLLKSRVLNETDLVSLTSYCQMWSQWLKVIAIVNRAGLTSVGVDQIERVSPYFTMQMKLSQQLVRIAQELGLSPASRSRIKAAPAEAPKDELEELLGGVG